MINIDKISKVKQLFLQTPNKSQQEPLERGLAGLIKMSDKYLLLISHPNIYCLSLAF
jgi:hypothetical protein